MMTHASDRRWWYLILGIAFVGLCLRFARVLPLGEERYLAGGYGFFLGMADRLLAGEGMYLEQFGTKVYALRTPGYPVWIAFLTTVAGRPWWLIALSNCLFGAGTIVVGALLARILFGVGAGLLAAVGIAFYPYYVFHDGMLQDTALYTFLLVMAFLLLYRTVASPSARGVALTGFLFGLAVLVRKQFILTAVPCLVWLWWRNRRLAIPRRWCAVGILVFVATLAPWLIRNYIVLGSPVLTTADGRQLWVGNNPWTMHLYPEQTIDESKKEAWRSLGKTTRLELQAMNEMEQRARFRQMAFDHIRAEPWDAVERSLQKIWAGFSPIKNPRPSHWFEHVGYTFSYTPVWLLAVISFIRLKRSWRDILPVYFALFSFTVVSVLAFSHSGHRAYLDVYLIVFSAGALRTVKPIQRWMGWMLPHFSRKGAPLLAVRDA